MKDLFNQEIRVGDLVVSNGITNKGKPFVVTRVDGASVQLNFAVDVDPATLLNVGAQYVQAHGELAAQAVRAEYMGETVGNEPDPEGSYVVYISKSMDYVHIFKAVDSEADQKKDFYSQLQRAKIAYRHDAKFLVYDESKGKYSLQGYFSNYYAFSYDQLKAAKLSKYIGQVYTCSDRVHAIIESLVNAKAKVKPVVQHS